MESLLAEHHGFDGAIGSHERVGVAQVCEAFESVTHDGHTGLTVLVHAVTEADYGPPLG